MRLELGTTQQFSSTRAKIRYVLYDYSGYKQYASMEISRRIDGLLLLTPDSNTDRVSRTRYVRELAAVRHRGYSSYSERLKRRNDAEFLWRRIGFVLFR